MFEGCSTAFTPQLVQPVTLWRTKSQPATRTASSTILLVVLAGFTCSNFSAIRLPSDLVVPYSVQRQASLLHARKELLHFAMVLLSVLALPMHGADASLLCPLRKELSNKRGSLQMPHRLGHVSIIGIMIVMIIE